MRAVSKEVFKTPLFLSSGLTNPSACAQVVVPVHDWVGHAVEVLLHLVDL
jgi:hypothetical protein